MDTNVLSWGNVLLKMLYPFVRDGWQNQTRDHTGAHNEPRSDDPLLAQIYRGSGTTSTTLIVAGDETQADPP